MPLRRLTGRSRSAAANRQLAALLAFVAGAVDVLGLLALRQFTSHMSGTVASLAADLAGGGAFDLLRPGVVLAAFLAGAALCALLVNWSRRRDHESLYALPLLTEALLLALAAFGSPHLLLYTLALLAFSMGLQNAIITKISHAEIRTTHVTGMITDIGIQLGRALYPNRNRGRQPVRIERSRLLLLSLLVALFFLGGWMGALAYPHFGLLTMLPLAVMLAAPTVLPIAADLSASARR